MRNLLGVLLLVAACGGGGGGDDGNNPPPDGPPGDGSDVPPGVVRVTVTKGATPQADVRVYFQNADSSVVSTTSTDASGVASAMMGAGGFVTVLDAFGGLTMPVEFHEVRTFAGVKPGDNLVVSQRDNGPINVTLVVPTAPNAQRYFLFSPCSAFLEVTNTNGSGGVNGPGGLIQLFHCDAITDMVIVALDADNKSISSLYAQDVAVAANATIDLTGGTYTAMEDSTWRYENVAAQYGGMDITSLLLTPRGLVHDTILNGVGSIGGVAMSLPAKTPMVPGALQADRATLVGPAFVKQSVLDWGPATTARTIALGDAVTPNVLVPDYTSEPVFDFAADELVWTIDTTQPAQPPEFAVAQLAFNRVSDDLFWNWQITAPNTAPALALPVLPDDGARLNPVGASDSVAVVNLTTARAPGGYDAVRAKVLSFESPFDFVTGTSGQVVSAELVRVP